MRLVVDKDGVNAQEQRDKLNRLLHEAYLAGAFFSTVNDFSNLLATVEEKRRRIVGE